MGPANMAGANRSGGSGRRIGPLSLSHGCARDGASSLVGIDSNDEVPGALNGTVLMPPTGAKVRGHGRAGGKQRSWCRISLGGRWLQKGLLACPYSKLAIKKEVPRRIGGVAMGGF